MTNAVEGKPDTATNAVEPESEAESPPAPAPESSALEAPPVAEAQNERVAYLLRELTTEAPTIGRVLPPPPPKAAVGVGFRQSTLSVDSLFVGELHVAACSTVGAGHLVTGTPRQDAYDVALSSTGRVVVAIADGMGSRASSQVGARFFCEAVTRNVMEKPDEDAASYLLAAGTEAGRLAQLAYGLSADDVSFVAAVAVVGVDRYDVARIGDVSAFTLDREGAFAEVFEDDSNTHLNVVTACLPTDKEPTPEMVSGTPRVALVLTTDGLANDMRTSGALRTWLASCWSTPLDAYSMADSMRYHRRGSHDDRTAVVISIPIRDSTGAQTEE